MKRWAAALGSLTVVCSLAACSSRGAGTSPASGGPLASQAGQVVADLAAGNFTAAAIFREIGDQHSEGVALGNLEAAPAAAQA